MLKEYLWNIIDMANEEENDGDTDLGNGISDAVNRFTAVLKGDERQSDYKCLADLDLSDATAKFAAMDKYQRNAEVNEIISLAAAKQDSLFAAWQNKDRSAFEAIVNG